MKETYPYLAYWKQRGFKRFPTIPPEELKRPYIEKFLEGFREKRREVLEKKGVHDISGIIETEEVVALSLERERLEQIIAARLQEKLDSAYKEMAQDIFEGAENIERDHSPGLRERTGRDLINKHIPDTHGGGLALRNNQKRILKRIYDEMKDCIKYVRKKIDPFEPSHSKNATWKHNEAEENKELVLENIPEVDVIFTEDELPLLFEQRSVAKTAAKIILLRLQEYSPRYYIAPRTFQDILTKVKPF